MKRTCCRAAIGSLVLTLGAIILLPGIRAASHGAVSPLHFQTGPDGSISFNTGVLRGSLRAGTRSLGVTGLVYVPRDLRLDGDIGLLGYYRLFSGNHRYLPDARDYPSRAGVLPDGSAEVVWEPAEGRPFGLRAVYRLVDAATIELETTVTARSTLPAFGVFQANYCSAAFSSCRTYNRGTSGGGDGFLRATTERGAWIMATRDLEGARLERDGRWRVGPNPVDWTMLPEYALPMVLRSDPASGVSLLFMTLPDECISVSTPQEKDNHFSAYFSLFGGDLAAGESRRTVSRLAVGTDLTERGAVDAVNAFVRGFGSNKNRSPQSGSGRKVLIATGQDYPGHLWKQTTPALRSGLEQDSRLAISVVEDPAFLDSAALDAYDAVILHFMNWEQPAPGASARAKLRKRVADGMGLMLVHFACGAFQDWPEFPDLAGRVWDPKLRGHDPYGEFEVRISDTRHPVTRGLGSFRTTDELYTCLTGSRSIHVIAAARSVVDGRDYPMAFVHDFGRGKVFHTVLGHDAQSLRNPGVARLLRRGCAWAAGLPPETAPQGAL